MEAYTIRVGLKRAVLIYHDGRLIGFVYPEPLRWRPVYVTIDEVLSGVYRLPKRDIRDVLRRALALSAAGSIPRPENEGDIRDALKKVS